MRQAVQLFTTALARALEFSMKQTAFAQTPHLLLVWPYIYMQIPLGNAIGRLSKMVSQLTMDPINIKYCKYVMIFNGV